MGAETMMDSPLSTIPDAEVLGAGVVRELPAEIALSAWQVLRWVILWGDEGRGSTAGLFDLAAMEEAVLDVVGDRPLGAGDDPRVPLVAIAGEFTQRMPNAQLIARACLCMSEWALPRQHLVTGLAFAEAAAFAMPCARYAFLAAKLHRQYGRHVDADRLLKVAEKLAREEKDWETNIRVRLARGNVDLLHGRYEQAKDVIVHALRTCERYRLHGAVVAEAHHDMLVAEAGLKDYASAVRHAESAMGAYGADHPRLPYLTHDLAGMWMEQGDYENALAVLKSLLVRHFLADPLPRLMVCASAVRAAAGLGDTATYTRLAAELDSVIARAVPVTVRHGPALVQAARGAAMARDAARLERWAKLAAAWGEQMQQPDVVADARSAAHRPSPPATARSRVRRNQGLAEKAVAALADSAAA
jgi:tetratricopeptide (TPR) repeat protein